MKDTMKLIMVTKLGFVQLGFPVVLSSSGTESFKPRTELLLDGINDM